MNVSVFWARVLGLYTVTLSIWSFIHMKIINPLESNIMIDFVSNPLYIFSLGIFTLFMGLLVFVSHQIWRGWPILVTLLGYWIITKAIILLFFSNWLHEQIVFWQGENSLIRSSIEFTIGAILLYCGFFQTKNA